MKARIVFDSRPELPKEVRDAYKSFCQENIEMKDPAFKEAMVRLMADAYPVRISTEEAFDLVKRSWLLLE
jgi:hypothetical protein|tara:strand:- start:510 stop:719 length:210 start_codon:yes stop_codon:yes gene_type:complete